MIYLMNQRYPACNRLLAKAPATLSPDESVISLPTRSFNYLLDEFLANTQLDLLKIDCKGHDREILRALDFNSPKPWVIAKAMSDCG